MVWIAIVAGLFIIVLALSLARFLDDTEMTSGTSGEAP